LFFNILRALFFEDGVITLSRFKRNHCKGYLSSWILNLWL